MEPKETSPIPPVAPSAAATSPAAQRYRSRLKYYIHDSIDVLCLQLTGELEKGDLGELSGCWRTAKTTLGSRKLLLDLRRLQTVDDGGRQWLLAMSAQESASFLPERSLHLQPGEQINLRAMPPVEIAGKWPLLSKLLGFCRGARVPVVKSSTPAP